VMNEWRNGLIEGGGGGRGGGLNGWRNEWMDGCWTDGRI
jgi:hypothetical protein